MLNDYQRKFIKENYSNMKTSEIADKLKITTKQVNAYGAGQCRLHKSSVALYNPKEISQAHSDLIFNHFSTGDLKWLSKKIGKKQHTIHEWARKRGLKREVQMNRRGDMSPLISGSLESFYWLGFIAADGYIYKNGHLMVSQAKKDKSNVDRLAKFLDTKVHPIKEGKSEFRKIIGISYRVNLSDKIIGNKIRDMFKIHPKKPKTYTGICVDFITNEKEAMAFLCGFIEGDGSLAKNSLGYHIECHKSWLKTFRQLVQKLPESFKEISLNVKKCASKKDAYTRMYIGKECSIELLTFAKENNIPTSKRKFPKI
jgi:hypothetical protein